jgi:phosphohistidine swiveling domain-containing protein
MRYIVWPDDCESSARLGGKAAALAALQREALDVPAWFVLAPEAFDASQAAAHAQTTAPRRDGRPPASPLERLTLAPAPHRELVEALARLCPGGEPVAVRSSAVEEDGTTHSFAGQLDSLLGVRPRDVPASVLAVWRSAFGERVQAYRRQRHLSGPPRPPAVLVQRMLDPECAGVAFSADPVSGRRDVAVISAVYGLGVGLVAGETPGDTYRVEADGRVVARELADKRVAYRCGASGRTGLSVSALPPAAARRPALSDAQARAVAALARRCERSLHRPQDIEWALADGRLFLLQSRPITTLPRCPERGTRRLWDNSNIGESYSGVTTPLTFSFARRAYEEVYRAFCRLMGVAGDTIEANTGTFRCMLGLIQGRMYYNLTSWYRVLSLLPGFAVNRRFMEQMMGLREALPPDILNEPGTSPTPTRLRDGVRLLRTLAGLLGNLALLERRTRRFQQRLQHALGATAPPLEAMTADQLVIHYRALERQLLTRWDAPVLNDFFAMVAHGLLRECLARWCPGPGLLNDLLGNQGDVISAEPAARIRELAGIARQDPTFVGLLCEGSLPEILDRLPALPVFTGRYRAYLEAFGDRCLGELKLESASLQESPLPLFRAVGRCAAEAAAKGEEAALLPESRRVRAAAEVRQALAGHPVRRLALGLLLRQARNRLRAREALRLERTRVFGRVRRIFLELGGRLADLRLLDEPRGVLFLEVDEVLGAVEGTAATRDLCGLVALRRAEYQRDQVAAPPPDRFETCGVVAHAHPFSSAPSAPPAPPTGCLRGLGCSTGVVRGRARLVTDPRLAAIRPGDILVAERTDPGWITLFASSAGVLTERGSLLSHAAIVARELGIPAVTSLPGLTRWLRDGDWVELDGRTGLVRRLEVPGHAG